MSIMSVTSARRELSKNVSHGAAYPRRGDRCIFEYFAVSYVTNEISTDAWQNGMCITRRRSTQSDARRPSVDGTLLPAVMDQIDNREFFTHHPHWTSPLIVHSRLDSDIQSATEMLLLKRRRRGT